VVFTDAELDYLRSQRLGRLATLTPDGTLRSSPVGFEVDAAAGVIKLGDGPDGQQASKRNVGQTAEEPR
jgi:pyridoxamine 5'-phosphate oxidase family protein